MSDASLDAVLHRVAAGELSPEDALALLSPAESPAAGSPAVESPAARAAGEPQTPVWGTREGTRQIRINASYRSVDILADPSVAEAHVSGTHSLRRDGETLVVESLGTPFGDGDAERGNRFSFADLPRGLAWARSWKEHHLTVRVNPAFLVELDGAGASVRASGLESGLKARLFASALKLERVRGPLDLDGMSTSVKGFATPRGQSRIVCESSSVKLVLGSGTDVRVRARNRLSKVILPSVISKGGLVDPEIVEARLGTGRDVLEVDATMSSVMLSAEGNATEGNAAETSAAEGAA